MTHPEAQIRVGLAYRDSILLVLSLRPIQMRNELHKFYHHFKDFISFPEKNIDHYSLMIRKLVKAQSIYYEKNRPVLTIKGKKQVKDLVESMSPKFQRKWEAFNELKTD